MGNVQNTFIKSKMNKDLDDRLLSKGEYRNAENVSVSRSESADVGALENVLGNLNINTFTSEPGVVAIGSYMDESTDMIYVFLTNYSDTSSNSLSNTAPKSAYCSICMYNVNSSTSQTLVKGSFLNFSTTHNMYGINVIEELLFWTDNRNQPRKINVNLASSADATSTYPHYYNEEQISLAKYYPYNVPTLWDKIDNVECSSTAGGVVTLSAASSVIKEGMYIKLSGTNSAGDAQSQNIRVSQVVSTTELIVQSTVAADLIWSSQDVTIYYPTSKNKATEFLAPSTYGILTNNVSSGSTGPLNITIPASSTGLANIEPKVGWNIISDTLAEDTEIQTIAPNPSFPNFQITLSKQSINDSVGRDQYLFAAPNPNYDADWAGDEDFLSDKFVRFAYRYKFEDGEYSLISPYTQPAFIPKQDGYITSLPGNFENVITASPAGTLQRLSLLLSQEEQIGNSTIIDFFENKVQNVSLNIETPYAVNTLANTLKVSDIEILYKESDALAVKVLDTIPVTDLSITSNSTTNYLYNYESRKPIKTLTEADTVRVYDKIPVRSKTQSVTGNRVVLGNFRDKHSSPSTLDFYVGVSPKLQPFEADTSYASVAYPNHTLKQNRSYQVGIVLQDKYGRSSDVILSSATDERVEFPASSSQYYGGSTVYAPYKSIYSSSPWSNDKLWNWFGDSLKVLIQNPIPNAISNVSGYPGIYKSGEIDAVATQGGSGDEFVLSGDWDSDIEIGDIVEGLSNIASAFSVSIIAIDVTSKTITLSENVSINASTSIKIYGRSNQTGYYSYKVVVKQTSQDYYNVYCPAPLSGSPNIETDQTEKTIITLLADNINKVPADLAKVSPVQTQFRTSDEVLFPRIAGLKDNNFSRQYYLGTKFFPVNTIGKMTDVGIEIDINAPASTPGIYTPNSNPSLGILNTTGTTYGNLYGSNVWGHGLFGETVAGDYYYLSDPRPVWEDPTSSGTILNIGTNPGAWSLAQPTFAVTGVGSGLTVQVRANTTAADRSDLDELFIRVVNGGQGYLPGDKVKVPAQPTDPTSNSSWTKAFIITIAPNDINIPQEGRPLGVLEVKPKESALDIYWETSTMGLISTLNKDIQEANAPYQPTALEFISLPGLRSTFLYEESNIVNTTISSFKVVRQDGTQLTSATASLTRVLDGNGTNVTNNFSLNTGGTGIFSLSNSVLNYFKQDLPSNSYTFTIDVVNTVSGLPYSNTFLIDGSLTNVTPSFTVCPAPVTLTTDNNYTFTLKAVNGAAGDQASKQLQWSQSDTNNDFIFLDSISGAEASTGLFNQQRIQLNNVADGTYVNSITVTDASGNGLTSASCNLSITVQTTFAS